MVDTQPGSAPISSTMFFSGRCCLMCWGAGESPTRQTYLNYCLNTMASYKGILICGFINQCSFLSQNHIHLFKRKVYPHYNATSQQKVPNINNNFNVKS